MRHRLQLSILPQPDDSTCGPTCLQAVYNYYGDYLELSQLVGEIEQFEEGGTLAVFLGCHALKRGYTARLHTYKLNMFDPTWFDRTRPVDLAERLSAQLHARGGDGKYATASHAYREFLNSGGRITMDDLTPQLIRRYMRRETPIITGLSATYLYRSRREISATNSPDDLKGNPVGHFVVICGANKNTKKVMIADPYQANPYSADHYYSVQIDRLIASILLGVVTYDGILLVIEPTRRMKRQKKT